MIRRNRITPFVAPAPPPAPPGGPGDRPDAAAPACAQCRRPSDSGSARRYSECVGEHVARPALARPSSISTRTCRASPDSRALPTIVAIRRRFITPEGKDHSESGPPRRREGISGWPSPGPARAGISTSSMTTSRTLGDELKPLLPVPSQGALRDRLRRGASSDSPPRPRHHRRPNSPPPRAPWTLTPAPPSASLSSFARGKCTTRCAVANLVEETVLRSHWRPA